jgi:GNAT superfamily N-acetyltransferase
MSMMNTVTIRRTAKEDFDAVFILLRQLWPNKELHEDAMKRVLDQALRSRSDVYLCATHKGKVIGFCSLTIKNSLWQEGCIGYIPEMVVEESYRGQGVGAALLQAAIDAAKQNGCKRIELDSSFQREEAHRFFEKKGFEKRAYLFSKQL